MSSSHARQFPSSKVRCFCLRMTYILHSGFSCLTLAVWYFSQFKWIRSAPETTKNTFWGKMDEPNCVEFISVGKKHRTWRLASCDLEKTAADGDVGGSLNRFGLSAPETTTVVINSFVRSEAVTRLGATTQLDLDKLSHNDTTSGWKLCFRTIVWIKGGLVALRSIQVHCQILF